MAMSTGLKKILMALGVFVGLAVLVFYQRRRDDSVGSNITKAADLPEIKGAEDVDKISLTNGEKGEVVLQKTGDQWAVTKPVNAPANQANVKQLIDNMKELKTREVIAPSIDDALKKEYQLDDLHALHVVAWKGDEKKVDDRFGKSGGRGQMVMVEGKPAVYAASGYSSYLYQREVKNWRDSEIFKFDDANASQLLITNTNGTFSFTKGDKWAGTFKGKPIANFDEEKVKDALRAFKSLTADDFGEGKTPADVGLDKPEAVVTIDLKDNAGHNVLKVGKVSTGAAHYAQREGNDTIYTIGSFASEWATAPLAKFQRAVDAGAPKDGGPKAALGAPHEMGMPAGHPPIH
jgi:hypothetical protein